MCLMTKTAFNKRGHVLEKLKTSELSGVFLLYILKYIRIKLKFIHND